jgi:hypothetical protein
MYISEMHKQNEAKRYPTRMLFRIQMTSAICSLELSTKPTMKRPTGYGKQ